MFYQALLMHRLTNINYMCIIPAFIKITDQGRKPVNKKDELANFSLFDNSVNLMKTIKSNPRSNLITILGPR